MDADKKRKEQEEAFHNKYEYNKCINEKRKRNYPQTITTPSFCGPPPPQFSQFHTHHQLCTDTHTASVMSHQNRHSVCPPNGKDSLWKIKFRFFFFLLLHSNDKLKRLYFNWFQNTHNFFSISPSPVSFLPFTIKSNKTKRCKRKKILPLSRPACIQPELRKLSASGSSLSLNFIR